VKQGPEATRQFILRESLPSQKMQRIEVGANIDARSSIAELAFFDAFARNAAYANLNLLLCRWSWACVRPNCDEKTPSSSDFPHARARFYGTEMPPSDDKVVASSERRAPQRLSSCRRMN
jgi:hypothetical protein